MLEFKGFITGSENGTGYVLTNKLFALAMTQAPVRSLVETALPIMRTLTQQIGQSCHIAVVSEDQIVVITRIERPGDLGFSVRIGYRREITRATSGLVEAFTYEAARWLGDDGAAAMVVPTAPTLPLAPAPEDEAPSKGPLGRVLVVDDNADMRDYVARLLRDQVDVVTAADGQAALRLMAGDPPDLVLSDVMMPRMDGFALLRAIRDGAQDTVNQAGQQIVQRQLQVAPTLTIRPGFPVRIILTRDLVFEPAGG